MNREYEYQGLCINGFMMIFFTFILVPLLILGCLLTGGESKLWLSVGGTAILLIVFILGCVG
ncbi:MAG: hypothetical protein K2N19_06780, partial [Muribaculaceae bacterium]|nr:hypothetical protein [Muribaculaceae bacterium]